MPDPATLLSLGLLGMFLAAFLAGSILPFPSELVLLGLLARGAPPAATVLVAACGNTLGALTLFLAGRGLRRAGPPGPLARWLAGDPERRERASAAAARWADLGLLLAWLPGVGELFVLGAGLLGRPWLRVTALVGLGKAARYAALAAWLVEQP